MRQSGFTLISKLLAVAIFSTLVAAAVPTYRSLYMNISLDRQANDLRDALNFARMEAIRRNSAVRVEAIDGDWLNGLNVRDVSGGQVLRTSRPDTTPAQINASATEVTFMPSGFADTGKSFIYCDDRDNEKGFGLLVASSGRIKSCKLAVEVCQSEESQEEGVSCG